MTRPTIELLSDAEAIQRVRQAEQDVAAGDVTPGDEMEKVVRDRRRGGT